MHPKIRERTNEIEAGLFIDVLESEHVCEAAKTVKSPQLPEFERIKAERTERYDKYQKWIAEGAK